MCTENLIFSSFREQEMRSSTRAEGEASIKQWGWKTKITLTTSGEEVRLRAVPGWPVREDMMGNFGVIWVGLMSEKGSQWGSCRGRREVLFNSYIYFLYNILCFLRCLFGVFFQITFLVQSPCVWKPWVKSWWKWNSTFNLKNMIIKFIDCLYSLLLNVLKQSHQ